MFVKHGARYTCVSEITGAEMVAWRRTRKLTRADFSKAIGYSDRAVLLWETGGRRVPCWMLTAMIEVGGRENMPKRRVA